LGREEHKDLSAWRCGTYEDDGDGAIGKYLLILWMRNECYYMR